MDASLTVYARSYRETLLIAITAEQLDIPVLNFTDREIQDGKRFPLLVESSWPICGPLTFETSRMICRHLSEHPQLCLAQSDVESDRKRPILTPDFRNLSEMASYEAASIAEVAFSDTVERGILEVLNAVIGLQMDSDSFDIGALELRRDLRLNVQVMDALNQLDKELDQRTWMANTKEFSLVDIYYIPAMIGLLNIDDEILNSTSNLKRWWLSLTKEVQLASIQKVLEANDLEIQLERMHQDITTQPLDSYTDESLDKDVFQGDETLDQPPEERNNNRDMEVEAARGSDVESREQNNTAQIDNGEYADQDAAS